MKKVLFLFSIAAIIVIACNKSDVSKPGTGSNNPPPSGEFSEPGYGSSNKPFQAANWNLPADVTAEDSIHEYSYCWAFEPYTQIPQKDWKGVPVGFPFCISLKNKSNKPVTIQFPPELVFVSSSLLHQNVLVIDLGTIQVPATNEMTIVAQGFCINKGRAIPETYTQGTEHFLAYSFGPSAIPPALKEITGILVPKHISMQDVLDANGNADAGKIEKYVVIQTALWEVTDGEGLTDATRKKLKEL